ncbi:MAG: helix-turn-helix transcriptional regulator [Acidobacteriaceae bacterium]|nr:helix-turn-helix transcriptional regulator [Acidobacteriaceae bacterium]MBV9441384.1 helix-turn-helix transcriptional regulator [Acidobacteriaceae bacterium]
MGDQQRLRLLFRLSEGAACVTELAEAERETLPTISQRLRVLRSEDLVKRKREGKHIRYALADDHVRELIAAVFAHARESKHS